MGNLLKFKKNSIKEIEKLSKKSLELTDQISKLDKNKKEIAEKIIQLKKDAKLGDSLTFSDEKFSVSINQKERMSIDLDSVKKNVSSYIWNKKLTPIIVKSVKNLNIESVKEQLSQKDFDKYVKKHIKTSKSSMSVTIKRLKDNSTKLKKAS